MALLRVRSFQRRILLAILAMVLIPATVTAVVGTLSLREIGTRSGTLGAWDSVAESGQALIASLDSAGVTDPAVRQAAARHRDALSESVRLSRLYAFVAERFVQILPIAVLVLGLVVSVVAVLTARALARSFSRPIEELVGWTESIAHGEPLPPLRADDAPAMEEFAILRSSVRTMAGQIEEGRLRAVEAARLRSWTDLARRVAHEIKNPLTAMRMAARSLPQGEHEADPARVLNEEIERLDTIARTFSQYGKMPEGPKSDVDLAELLRSLAVREQSALITVDGATGVVVRGHYDALQRAFRNLLVNAAEASEDGGRQPGHESGGDGEPRHGSVGEGAHGRSADGGRQPGHVSAGERAPVHVVVQEADGVAVVEISDEGPGIPEDIIDTIWNPDVSTKRSGTGLGLSIVRRTVELHDGSVEAANRPEGGALFRVRLPRTSQSRDAD